MTKTNREIADELMGYPDDAIRAAIEAALDAKDRAAVPPEGHLIDDTRTLRKVLGDLPLTADGCVIGVCERPSDRHVYWVLEERTKTIYPTFHPDLAKSIGRRVYSTREAAEAARTNGANPRPTPHRAESESP